MWCRLRGTPREFRTRDRPVSVAFRNNAARKQDYSNQSAIRETMARVVERREYGQYITKNDCSKRFKGSTRAGR